jgi:hypothetical protein
VHVRELLVAVTRVLPGWLSSFGFSLIFLWVWLNPHWFGWEHLDGLQVVVYLEVASVYGLLLLLGGRDERFSWLPALPVALFLGVFVAGYLNPWLGVGFAVHIIARVAGVWSDLKTVRVIVYEALISGVLMVGAWLTVGLLPLPSFGWGEAVVPRELWAEAMSWSGDPVRLSYTLPAWGFFYFLSIALADALHLAERFERWWGAPM